VARNSFGGYYSILHSVYDKTNSTFGGTSLNAIGYSQYINADRLILASGGQITFPDATVQTTAWTGSLSSLETTHTVNLASSPSASGDGSVITVADNTATTKILLNNSLGVLGRATLPTLTTWGKIVIMVSQSTFDTNVDFRLSDNSYANLTTVIPTTSSYGLNPQNGIKIAMSMAQFGWRLI
jgi:hypothetical protein